MIGVVVRPLSRLGNVALRLLSPQGTQLGAGPESGGVDGVVRRAVGGFGGMTSVPLLILAALFFVDQLDTAAFGILTPEIKSAFGLSSFGVGLVIALNFLVAILFVVILGWLGDRFNRCRLTQLGAALAGIGTVLTGGAVGLASMVTGRIVNGAGVITSSSIHRSLITDYYPHAQRGKAYSFHQAADSLSQVIGPILIGIIAAAATWRMPFLLIGIPISLLLLAALRLPEPVRGGLEDAGAALEAQKEAPIPFEQSIRTLAQIPTMRRTWLAFFFIGGGFVPLAGGFFSLFFTSVFDVPVLARGLITSGLAVMGLLGFVVVGRVIRSRAERLPLLQLLSGAVFVVVALCLVLTALAPTAVVAIAFAAVLAFFGAWYVPLSTVVQAQVIPARIRTQGFAFSFLCLAAGVFLAPLTGTVADDYGLRPALLSFTPFLLVGGLVLMSAASLVEADRRRALASLELAATLREERLSAGARSLLVCRKVNVSYDRVQVLFDVDFEVREGQLVALLGTNGAGKSTLLKAVAGTVTPDSGLIFFDGREISALTPWQTAMTGASLMPGGKSVFPTLTVAENLRMALWLHRHDRSHCERRIKAVLEIFPRLRERYGEAAGNMSGGEQQMLSLAQALTTEPRLLMIDELSLGLAPKVVRELLDIIREIHARGVTIVLVEQSVNVALTIAERAYFMEKGQMRFSGDTAELLQRRDLLRSVFLEGASKAVETMQ